MASRNIREYAVTLKADAKDALKSLGTFRTVVNATQTSVTNAFAAMSSSVVKSTNEMNAAIDKLIMAESKLSGGVFQKATDDMKKAIKDQKLSAEERVKIKQETVDKLLAEEKRLSAKTAPLKAQKTPTPAASKAPTGVFKFDITEIAANIDSVRQLQKGLATSSSEMNFNMRSQFQKLMADNVADVKDGQKELTKILEGARDKQLQEQSNFFKAQIDAAKGQPDKINQLTKESVAKRGQIIAQGAAQIAAVKSKAAEQVSRTQDAEQRRSLLSLEDAQRDRLRRIIESNREEGRTLRDKERVFRDAQKDIAKALGSFKLDILQIEKDEPIKDMRTLGSVLANTQKETDQRLKAQLRKFSGNKIGDIDDAEKKIIAILTEASKKRIIEAEAAHKKMLGVVGKNKEERLKLEKEFGKQRVQIEKQTNAQIAATSQTAGQRRKDAPSEVQTGRIGAGGKIFGKIKGALGGAGDKISAIGQGAADQVPGLGKLSGGLQNVLAKAGPYGKAAAAVVGATVAVGAVMVKAAAKADLFNRAAKGLENATGFTGDKLAGLKDQLLQIPRPASQSAEDIAKLAGNVAKFEKPENIVEVTKSITELARLEPDIDVGKLSAGVGRLGKAFGSTQLAMDLMAATAKELKGKAQDPLDEATTELGVVFSKATLAIGDTSRAAKESAAVFTVLTETGFEVSEATTAAEEIFLKLNDAVTDPKLAKALQKDLPEGMKLADIGIDGVNSSAVKMIQFMQEGGESAKKIATTLGSTAGEALSILQSQFQKTGLNIDDFTKKFDNIEGAAGNIAASLITPMQAANEKLKTSFDRLFIGVGQSFAGSTFGVDILADAMAGLADFMLPVGVQLDNQIAKLGGVNDELSTLDGLIANVDAQGELFAAGEAEESVASATMKQIIDNIGIIEERSPVVAAQIKAIGDSKLPLNEQLAQTQNLLKGIQGIVEQDAIAQSFQAQTLAVEKFNETLNESSSIWSTLANVGDTILDIGLVGYVLPDFSDMVDADQFLSIDESVASMKEKFTGLQEELTTLDPKTQAWKDKMDEAAEVQKELGELTKTQSALTDGFESKIQKVLAAKLSEKDVNAENIDLERLKNEIISKNGNEALRDSAEFNQMVTDELNKQLEPALQKAEIVNAETAATANLMTIKTDLASTEESTKEAALSRLETLFQEGTITDEILNKKAAEEGLTNQLNAIKLESLNSDMAALEAKKLINGTLDEADAKELAMLNKKMAASEADITKGQNATAFLATQEQILVATIAGIEANQAGSQMLSEEQTAELAILNTKLEKVNAEQLSIDLKAQAAELTFEEADANEAIALQIEEKLGFEEASNEEKLKAIEALQTENAAQIALVETEITGLKATIAAEDAKQAILIQQLETKNQLLEAEGKEPIAIKKSTNAQREKLAELETQLGVLKAAGKALGTAGGKTKKSIALDKGLGTERIKAARQARKDQKRAAKDAAKAADKAAKKAAKDAEKNAKAAAKQEKKTPKEVSTKDSSAEREKVIKENEENQKKIKAILEKEFIDRERINKARLKAEEIFIKSIMDFRKKLIEQSKAFTNTTFKNIKNIISPFQTIGQRLGETLSNVTSRFTDYNATLAKQQEGILIQINNNSKAQKEIARVAKVTLLSAKKKLGSQVVRDLDPNKKLSETGKGVEKLGLAVEFLKEKLVKLGVVSELQSRTAEQNFTEANRVRASIAGRAEKRVKGFKGRTKNFIRSFDHSKTSRDVSGLRFNAKAAEMALEKTTKKIGRFDVVLKTVGDRFVTLNEKNIALEGKQKALLLEINDIRRMQKETEFQTLAQAKKAGESLAKEKEKIVTTDIQDKVLTKDEKQAINDLERIGKGFSLVNNELAKIAELQKSARLTDDSEAAAKLYAEANKQLKRLNEDLEKGNITVEDLASEYDIVAKQLESIREKLTDEQKTLLDNLDIVRDTTEDTSKQIKLEGDIEDNLLNEKLLRNEILLSAEALNSATALLGTLSKDNVLETTRVRNEIDKTIMDLAAREKDIKQEINEEEDARNTLLERRLNLLAKIKEAEEISKKDPAKKDVRRERQREDTLLGLDKMIDDSAEATKGLNKELKTTGKLAKDVETARPELMDQSKVKEVSDALGNLAPNLDKRSNEIFGLLGNFSDKAGAIGDAFALGEEGSEKALQSLSGLIQDTTTVMAGLIDAGSQAAQDVIKIGDMFGSGDTLGAVAGAADMSTQIGTALLKAGGPLATAGAVLLGVGLITKAVTSIISLIVGTEKTSLQVAEDRKREQEEIQGVYEAQIGKLDTLQELESNLTDTARERLDILTKEHDLLTQNSAEARVNAGLTDDQLTAAIATNAAEQARLNSIIKQGEAVVDQDEDARAEFLDEESNVDFGSFAGTGEVEAFVGRIKAQLVDLETDSAGLDLELDFRSMSLQEIAAVFDELKSTSEKQIDFSIDLGDIEAAKAELEALKDAIITVSKDTLSEVGIDTSELAGMTTDELKALFLTLEDIQITPEIIEMFDELIGVTEQEKDTLEGISDVNAEHIDARKEILELQKELGLISSDEFDLQSIELLNEKLDLLKKNGAATEDILAAQLELLDFQQAEVDGEIELIRAKERAGKLTNSEANELILVALEDELALLHEIGASEMRILDVEGEILELKESQNEQDLEAERLLTDKVRNLQKVLDLARAESGGGTPTAQGKEQITQAREDIVTELKAQGRSDEFINEFLESLPKFKEGGFNPGFGLAEPGEFVFKAPTVAAIGKDVLNMINQNPFALGNMQSDRIVADTFLKKEAAILTMNNNTDIFLNMNIQTSPGQSSAQIGDAIGTSVELKLVPTINKLFQQNKINNSLGGVQ